MWADKALQGVLPVKGLSKLQDARQGLNQQDSH